MDISSILLAIIVFLAVTALCVILFERLGFGAILGFIAAGIIIGPHTPGPVPVHAVDELQSVAEFGVVLFMFTVGLEISFRQLQQTGRVGVWGGITQIVATFILGTLAGTLLLHNAHRDTIGLSMFAHVG